MINPALPKEEFYLSTDKKHFMLIDRSNKFSYATNTDDDYNFLCNVSAFNKFIEKAPVTNDTIHKFEFNVIFDTHIIFSVTRKELLLALDYCTNNDSKYYANGFVYDAGHLVASDALKLIKININTTCQKTSGIIPRYAISRMLKIDKSEHFVFSVDDDNFLVNTDNGVFTGKLISGTYPPYEPVICDHYFKDANSFEVKKPTALEIAEAKTLNKKIPQHKVKDRLYNQNDLITVLKTCNTVQQDTRGLLRFKSDNCTLLIVPLNNWGLDMERAKETQEKMLTLRKMQFDALAKELEACGFSIVCISPNALQACSIQQLSVLWDIKKKGLENV